MRRLVKPTSQIKPVSDLKAHTAEVIRHLNEGREPLIVTQNGEAKAVMQDIATFEETQETLALLKILALGNREVETGDAEPASDVFARLRQCHVPTREA